MVIPERTSDEIEKIRQSGRIVYLVQRALEQALAPGMTTSELDALAESTIRDCGAVPAFKGYRGFPASICTSVNAVIVHGIPNDQAVQPGDIVSIDVGVILDDYFGDGAFTLGIGDIDEECRHLLDVTQACLELGIAQARVGNRLSDISHAVQSHAEHNQVSVVREFGGHGIGRKLHEDPHILNYGPPGTGPHLRAGNVFALEPILSTGRGQIVTHDDQWTTTTRDSRPAAHFEHTIAVTEEGPEILTLADPTDDAGSSPGGRGT